MRGVAHYRRIWRWGCTLGALLILALAAAALAPASVTAQAQAQATVLARGRPDLPGEALLFKLNEVPLPAGEPAVTQAHAWGFDYAVSGTEVLTAGGTPHVTPPGQATWIGEQEEHTHAPWLGRRCASGSSPCGRRPRGASRRPGRTPAPASAASRRTSGSARPAPTTWCSARSSCRPPAPRPGRWRGPARWG